jgi:general secretion pathway protein L
VEGLPAGAAQLAAELRQTLGAWAATGEPAIEGVVLVGVGATMPGAEPYLSRELGVPVASLPPVNASFAEPAEAEVTARFAKALGLALGLAVRPRDPDLRQGELAFQRGFGFLRERVPMVAGLCVALAVSFGFSLWAEHRALGRERESLAAALETQSQEALGEATSDPARVTELLEKAKGGDELDPMPHMDAFDVLVELSKGLPTSVVHDIEQFDMQRGHVRISGIVGSAGDAQMVASVFKAHRCVVDPKIGKLSQVVNSERQKYSLEFDVRCPEDSAPKKKNSSGEAAPETP